MARPKYLLVYEPAEVLSWMIGKTISQITVQYREDLSKNEGREANRITFVLDTGEELVLESWGDHGYGSSIALLIAK